MVLALRCNKRCDDNRVKSHCMLVVVVECHGVGIIMDRARYVGLCV